jgi:phosphoglucomutase
MSIMVNPLAGKPAPKSLLVDVTKLLAAYIDLRPDPTVPSQRVGFGTSGHRGVSFERSFNEWHVLAISQAICEYRKGASVEQEQKLAKLSPQQLGITQLAGERIESIIDRAPANGAPIGGIKVTSASCWFAARPSGTEDIYKIYAESFRGEEHLRDILSEAQGVVDVALAKH